MFDQWERFRVDLIWHKVKKIVTHAKAFSGSFTLGFVLETSPLKQIKRKLGSVILLKRIRRLHFKNTYF